MTRRSAPTIRMPDGLFDLLDEAEPEVASTPDVAPIKWPLFATVDGLSGSAKAQAATDLIAFIEAGFPKDVWESGQLRFLLQGAFTPQYEITAQKLWEDAFSSGPRQALWLEQLIPDLKLRSWTRYASGGWLLEFEMLKERCGRLRKSKEVDAQLWLRSLHSSRRFTHRQKSKQSSQPIS